MFQTINLPITLLAATAILAIHSLPTRHITVFTPCGEVTGSISSTAAASRPIAEFHNIPYAEPPVGNHRFSPPRRYHGNNRWSGRIDASQDKVIKCVQGGVLKPVSGTEDCLVLTIRSPDVTTLRPVLVWIHGGGLSVNYCCERGYTFDAHLTDRMDVVIVSINYRLGFLGFQSIEELRDGESGNLTPNNGLRDMIEALHWVQENIAHFGGDPHAVTLLGHSAGASATLALIASPLATNTFHRVMALSPATEMRLDSGEGSVYQEMLYDAVRRTGCDVASNIRQCLLEQPAEVFTSYRDFNPSGKLDFYNFNGYFDFPNNHTAEPDFAGWLLTDEEVVPLPPRQLSEMQETYLYGTISPISTMEVLISNTVHENSYASMVYQYNIITEYHTLNNTLKDVLPRVTSSPVDDVMTMIYEEYGPLLSPQSIWDMLVTDIRSTCPTNELAAAMSRSSHHQIYRLLVDATPNNIPAFHGIDTEILFGYVFTSPVVDTSGEVFQNLRNVMVDLIADFVKVGVPVRHTFPSTTMRLSNTGPDVSLDIGTDIPREKICERLRSLGLSGYGWQN